MLAIPAAAQPQTKTPSSGKSAPQPVSENARYCGNIADAAADARFVLQKEALARMEGEIEGRLKVLEAKRAEYEVWLRRRQDVLEKADDTVVKIYSGMRPDAAAVQIAAMENEVAAGILAKLKARTSSAILNEMEPARAAQLANAITDAPNRRAKPQEKL